MQGARYSRRGRRDRKTRRKMETDTRDIGMRRERRKKEVIMNAL